MNRKISKFITSATLCTAIIGGLLFTGCRKPENDNDTAVATDNSIAETESNQVIDAAQSTMIDNGLGRVMNPGSSHATLLPSCASVTLDTIAHNITVNFGTTNCLCSDWDGKYRRGIIQIHYTGHYSDSGTVIHITTQDYFVNDNEYTFDKTVTNMGHNSLGQPYFNIHVATSTVVTPTGQITWTSDRVRTWTSGSTTTTPYDDVYEITGTASGTSRNGTDFTIIITSPLVKEIGCRWITQGNMEIAPQGLATRFVDFGSGNCDSEAKVTVNGVTFTINLN